MRYFITYAAIVLLPFLYSMTHYTISPSDCLGILGGFTIWTFAEYMFHRFAFHNNNLSPRTHELLAYDHVQHHENPKQSDLFLPLQLTLPIALVLALMMALVVSIPFATFLLIGLFAGLSYYEFVHYQAHNKMYNIWPLNRRATIHMRHHYENEDKMFGVTTSFWDWVFGTK